MPKFAINYRSKNVVIPYIQTSDGQVLQSRERAVQPFMSFDNYSIFCSLSCERLFHLIGLVRNRFSSTLPESLILHSLSSTAGEMETRFSASSFSSREKWLTSLTMKVMTTPTASTGSSSTLKKLKLGVLHSSQ